MFDGIFEIFIGEMSMNEVAEWCVFVAIHKNVIVKPFHNK